MNALNPIGYLILQAGNLLNSLFDIYAILLFVYIVLQLLVHLQVINAYKPFFRQFTVGRLLNFFSRWYEPPLNAIRRKLPPIGGIDLSPLVLFLLINVAGYAVWWVFMKVALLVG